MQSQKRRRDFEMCDVVDALSCTLCSNLILPPVMQCQNGHLLCQSCASQLRNSQLFMRCPDCKVVIHTFTRNRVIEELVTCMEIECKYAGCCTVLEYSKMTDHQSTCSRRTFDCPITSETHQRCKWHGSVHEMIAHIGRDHRKKAARKSGVLPVVLMKNDQCSGAAIYLETLLSGNASKFDAEHSVFVFLRRKETHSLVRFTKHIATKAIDNLLTIEVFNFCMQDRPVRMHLRWFKEKEMTQVNQASASSSCVFLPESVRDMDCSSGGKAMHLQYGAYFDFLKTHPEGQIEWSMES